MKGIISLAIMLLVFTLSCEAQAKAQTLQRIQFAKGKISAVVKGTTGSSGVAYVVKAGSGQKLVLSLTPASAVGIKVTTDGANREMVLLREKKGGTYEVGLEMSGDYTIFIGSVNNKSVPFTLTIKITKLADV